MPAQVFICILTHDLVVLVAAVCDRRKKFVVVHSLGGRLIVVRRSKSEQLSKTRFVRFAGRAIAVRLNPFWMFDAQSLVYLSLKLSVRADFLRRFRKSVCFHATKRRQRPKRRHFAYAGFSSATSGVTRNPSFERERERLVVGLRTKNSGSQTAATTESSRAASRWRRLRCG